MQVLLAVDAGVLRQGRKIPGVIAALAGSPELAKIERDYEVVFIEKCQIVVAPFTGAGGIASAGLWAMLDAAEALFSAAAAGEITPTRAKEELFETIVGMVARSTLTAGLGKVNERRARRLAPPNP